MTEQHFLKQNESGEWGRDTVTVARVLREAAWFLEDKPGGAARLWVVGGATAEGLRLTPVFDAFESAGTGVLRSSMDFLRGLKVRV